MRVAVDTHIEAPPERVWAVLVDWESQARWMVDARTVTVLGERREGVGTRLRCPTALFGVVEVDDELEVIEWHPPTTLGVRHSGWLIRGVAAFELDRTDHGTHVRWWEEIVAPLGGVGELAAPLVERMVARVFTRSLAGLKRVVEHHSVRPDVEPGAGREPA